MMYRTPGQAESRTPGVADSRTLGRALTGAGIILILAALALTLHNLHEERNAERAASEVLESLEPEIRTAEQRLSEEAAAPVPGEIPYYILNPEIPMPEITVDGNSYIGTLEIVPLDLTLPVMSAWDYTKLKTAPCRYSGSAYTGDLVICAHNYARHFSGIKGLSPGGEVRFTDVRGNRFRYEIVDAEILAPSEVEDMVTGDWDLTLFTCTTGGQTRFALRCGRDPGPAE